MPQDIKIWEITEGDDLKEIQQSKLNLEERLENWIEKDISILSDDLLVIGRQVPTDFGGCIDILCIDCNGDIVIVELKRDKTPREITAQVLDYGSWAKDLSNEKITEIADAYLKAKGQETLEKTFKEKFDMEFPEILNESHKMLIVGSEIDDKSERIIEYLSDSYGVGINAATFQYFKHNEKEFLSRVFLIEPSEADYRIQTKRGSKRKPALSYEELEEIANRKKVGDVYRQLIEGLSEYFDYKITTRSSVAFIGVMGENKSRKTIFSIVPTQSNQGEGLEYTIYVGRFLKYFRISQDILMNILPNYRREADRANREFGGGYFKNNEEVDKFLQKLSEIKQE